MITHIIYPVPLDNPEVWELFKPAVKRFTDTYKQFPPGCEHTIVAVCNKADPPHELREMFYDMPVDWLRYNGDGADLGSQQFAAMACGTGFHLNCTTRSYFHRAGWLEKLLWARLSNGAALYGCTASCEGGKSHLCTRNFAYDVEDFLRYPHVIHSRDRGVFFELGDGCMLDWFLDQRRSAYLVTWDGLKDFNDWFNIPNGYRNGDQSNVLIWDKHTQAYADADAAEKSRLEKMMKGDR